MDSAYAFVAREAVPTAVAMGVDMVETAIATRSTVGDALQAAAEAHASNGALDEVLVARSAPTLGESWQSS